MEENKTFLLDEEAMKIIKMKLSARRISTKGGNWSGQLINENCEIEVNPTHRPMWLSSERIDYTKVNIAVKTIQYPHKRRAIKGFDVENGDYKLLKQKVYFIIAENKKMKTEILIKEDKTKATATELKQKLQGLGAIKRQYFDGFEIKTKYFSIVFVVDEENVRVDIEENKELTVDQAIELIKKVKGQ